MLVNNKSDAEVKNTESHISSSCLREEHQCTKGTIHGPFGSDGAPTNSTLRNAVSKLEVRDTGTGVEEGWLVELVNRGEVAGAEGGWLVELVNGEVVGKRAAGWW